MVVNLIRGNFNDKKMAAITVQEQRTSYSSGKKAFQRNLQVENLPSSAKTYLVNFFCRRNVAQGH